VDGWLFHSFSILFKRLLHYWISKGAKKMNGTGFIYQCSASILQVTIPVAKSRVASAPEHSKEKGIIKEEISFHQSLNINGLFPSFHPSLHTYKGKIGVKPF
jgi:hypothetical protein